MDSTNEVNGLLGRGQMVLVVDDEQPVLDLLQDMLCSSNYQVITANDGSQALRVMSKNDLQLDLMICDVIMPGLTGIELVDIIRKEKPKLPVIFISGYPQGSEMFMEAQTRHCQFLAKPFTYDTLLLAVKVELGKKLKL